jgi:hypothetical protein
MGTKIRPFRKLYFKRQQKFKLNLILNYSYMENFKYINALQNGNWAQILENKNLVYIWDSEAKNILAKITIQEFKKTYLQFLKN